MIDTNCLKNKNLEKLLLREENIPILEELFYQEQSNLEEIKSKKEFDPGKKIKEKDLEKLLADIKVDVSDFLQMSDFKFPEIKYKEFLYRGNEEEIIKNLFYPATLCANAITFQYFYDMSEHFPLLMDFLMLPLPIISSTMALALYLERKGSSHYLTKSKEIIIGGKYKKKSLIPIIAHEYVHAIQFQNLERLNNQHNIFFEGHATKAEEKIASKIAERENNSAYLYFCGSNNISHLRRSYAWLCHKLKKPMNEKIVPKNTKPPLNLLFVRISTKNRWLKPGKKPSQHDLGTALFSIYEAQYGPDIYKDVLTGKFKFPIAE